MLTPGLPAAVLDPGDMNACTAAAGPSSPPSGVLSLCVFPGETAGLAAESCARAAGGTPRGDLRSQTEPCGEGRGAGHRKPR